MSHIVTVMISRFVILVGKIAVVGAALEIIAEVGAVGAVIAIIAPGAVTAPMGVSSGGTMVSRGAIGPLDWQS